MGSCRLVLSFWLWSNYYWLIISSILSQNCTDRSTSSSHFLEFFFFSFLSRFMTWTSCSQVKSVILHLVFRRHRQSWLTNKCRLCKVLVDLPNLKWGACSLCVFKPLVAVDNSPDGNRLLGVPALTILDTFIITFLIHTASARRNWIFSQVIWVYWI